MLHPLYCKWYYLSYEEEPDFPKNLQFGNSILF